MPSYLQSIIFFNFVLNLSKFRLKFKKFSVKFKLQSKQKDEF
ncbi:hypothetical protein HMPREF1139_0969 [Campylobacter sp. FOBRC14]|nr:hypothetical protein HMPREF1139_0969 [Campylobacter sp. FOBRC14]